MLHAFTWLPSPYRWILLVTLLAGTVAYGVKLKNQGKPLVNPAAPQGILSYEFAWSSSRAEAILNSWSSQKDVAKRQLWLDFGFLIVYPLLLSLACAMLSESPHNSTAIVGVFISWAVLASGPLDAVENFVLLGCSIRARAGGWRGWPDGTPG